MSGPRGLDRDLVCVDLETTGGNPVWHRILEIGTVGIDRDGTVSEWSTLVNPGVRIPPSIVAFTGIDDAMVADAPSFEAVRRELLERLSGRLFVAHNARFDYGFIRAELARLGIPWSTRPLCTVKLSRRLFPESPRHNLDALIERHGLRCTARHRALGDAQVLRELLAVLRRQLPVARLEAAVEALLTETPLPPQLPAGLADDLPESAGVYRFYGESDALLYVGRSSNLRGRILEHFAPGQTAQRAQQLAAQVRRIEWTATAGELGALLAEAHTIKRAQPLLNRRLKSRGATWTLRPVPHAEAPLQMLPAEVDALAPTALEECYGLFRDARAAWRALEEIARAHTLCARVLGLEGGSGAVAEQASCFALQLGRCRGACIGREPAALHDTRLRLALASQRLKPWPYRGRILIAERDWRGVEDLHLLAHWRYLGTVQERDQAEGLDADAVEFDPDVYKIVRRYLAASATPRIIELD